MKILTTLLLVLLLTVHLTYAQDLNYYPEKAGFPKLWNANEGQMLKHMYTTNLYYQGSSNINQKEFSLTTTLIDDIFDSNEDVNVGASLISFQMASPGNNGGQNPSQNFIYIQITSITLSDSKKKIDIKFQTVREGFFSNDNPTIIKNFGLNLILIGTNFGKTASIPLAQAFTTTGRMKNVVSDSKVNLYQFQPLKTTNRQNGPFQFVPTQDQKNLCGAKDNKVYLHKCPSYKLLTTIAGFYHTVATNDLNFRVSAIPVKKSEQNQNQNDIKTNGNFDNNVLQLGPGSPDYIYSLNGGINLITIPNISPSSVSAPAGKLFGIQVSMTIITLDTASNNYPANAQNYFVAFGAIGYPGDSNFVTSSSEFLRDGLKSKTMKLSDYKSSKNMGHMAFGAQLIDKSQKFDLRVDVDSNTQVQAFNAFSTNERYGVGAMLFSNAVLCEDVLKNLISTKLPDIKIQQSNSNVALGTASYVGYGPVIFNSKQRDLHTFQVKDLSVSSKYTITITHNYQIPANVDSVLLDVQFRPAVNVPPSADQNKKVNYKIQVGNQLVSSTVLIMATANQITRRLLVSPVNSATSLNVIITVTSENQGFMQSLKIDQGLFSTSKVLDNGVCADQCSKKPNFVVGYDFNTSPKSCKYCPSLLFQTYSSADNGKCICINNYYPVPNSSPLQCKPCIDPLCLQCKPSGSSQVCETCTDNANLNGDKCKCNNKFYKKDNICVPCAPACLICTGNTCSSCKDSKNADGVTTRDTECKCIDEYYQDPAIITDTTAVCKKCAPTCQTCAGSPTFCLTCFENKNFIFTENKCICKNGYYLVGANCVSCNQKCATCQVSSIYCKSCPDKRELAGIIGTTYQTCTCKHPYIDLDGSCVDTTCTTIDPKCQQCGIIGSGLKQCHSCIDNRIVSQNKCICKPNFYEAANGNCVPCPNGCQECTATTCKCANNAFPNPDGTCSCQDGLVIIIFAHGIYCKPCNPTCQTCIENQNKCKSCKHPFVPNSANQCVCPARTYFSAGQCLPCLSNCQKCQNGVSCQDCRDGYLWNSVSLTCTLDCPVKQYNGGSECLPCPQGCANCISSYLCNECEPGFNLFAGSCRKNCPDSTYAQGGKCYPCPQQCQTCQSLSICQTCKSPLVLLGHKCLSDCPQGTFYANTQSCISCDPTCATCKRHSKFCISCKNPQILYENSCYDDCPVAIVDGKCTKVCPEGKFYKDKACVDCNPKCKTCQNSPQNCLQCASGLSYNGNCVDSCPQGTFKSGNTCSVCDVSCKTCIQNAFKCLECAANFVRSGPYCVKGCEHGTYFDAQSSSCKPCGTGCKTCTSPNICTTCFNPLLNPVGGNCQKTCPIGASLVDDKCVCDIGFLHNSVCLLTCPKGFYAKTDKICAQCSFPCFECSNSAHRCQSCIQGYTFDSKTNTCSTTNDCQFGQYKDSYGRCIRICPFGHFFYNSGCVHVCPPGFVPKNNCGCIRSYNPHSCEFPLFRQGNTCVSTCLRGFYPDTTSRICRPCSQNCVNCLSADLCLSCAHGFQPNFDQSQCIESLDCGPNRYQYNNQCYSQCPIGTYQSGQFCIRSCRRRTYLYEGLCYSTCPTPFQTHDACFNVCPAGYQCREC